VAQRACFAPLHPSSFVSDTRGDSDFAYSLPYLRLALSDFLPESNSVRRFLLTVLSPAPSLLYLSPPRPIPLAVSSHLLTSCRSSYSYHPLCPRCGVLTLGRPPLAAQLSLIFFLPTPGRIWVIALEFSSLSLRVTFFWPRRSLPFEPPPIQLASQPSLARAHERSPYFTVTPSILRPVRLYHNFLYSFIVPFVDRYCHQSVGSFFFSRPRWVQLLMLIARVQ